MHERSSVVYLFGRRNSPTLDRIRTHLMKQLLCAQDMSHRGEGNAVLVISQFSHNLSVSLNNASAAKNLKLTQVEHACSPNIETPFFGAMIFCSLTFSAASPTVPLRIVHSKIAFLLTKRGIFAVNMMLDASYFSATHFPTAHRTRLTMRF